ncbi:hypothetical protein UFOVP353_46 [uncultured Caudovirales phage]|uniref:Uncharacterized protein n=1 Tax=uncultured Caudovirales phage TaxID=2100421 RepID=A0A6J5M7Q7_9CAUD|nr:hypothetical protein UFOVP353_46 [uncultured Caudovirales phage]
MNKLLIKKPASGLVLASFLLLSACANSPSASVIPDYPPEFLEKVADQYQTRTYGEETAQAITDWSILIDD